MLRAFTSQFIFFCLFLPCLTAQAQDTLTEEEKQILAQAAKEDAASTQPVQNAPVAQGLMPDTSFILNVAGAYFSDEPAQVGAHDPNKTGFTLQQLEMNLSSSVDPFFTMNANIVFSLFGVEVEEAYVSTTMLPGNLQLRAGQFLTKFGRTNATHPHQWAFLDQPLGNGKFFGPEGSRGLGLELSWLMPLPWFSELIGAVNNADNNCCARSFLGAQNDGVDGLEDFLYTLTWKQFFETSRNTMILLGASAQFGPNPTGKGNRTEIYGADLTFRYRPDGEQDRTHLTWQTQWMLRRRQVPFDVLMDMSVESQIVFQVNQSWGIGARYEWVQGVDSPEEWLDPNWTNDRHRANILTTYSPSHFSKIRLQFGRDTPVETNKGEYSAMLGLEVVIGAHGAHQF